MKYFVVGMAVLTVSLMGQAGAKKDLTDQLLNLQRTNPRHEDLTNVLMAIPDPNHPAARVAVVTFARDLAATLGGRSIPAAALNEMADTLVTLLRSARLGTAEYRALVPRFEKALLAAGVSSANAQRVSGKVADVGKSVRGPEDMPVQPLGFLGVK